MAPPALPFITLEGRRSRGNHEERVPAASGAPVPRSVNKKRGSLEPRKIVGADNGASAYPLSRIRTGFGRLSASSPARYKRSAFA